MRYRDCRCGIGGLTATITAKLAGLQPILLEKLPQIGGSSALSGGVLWLPNTPDATRRYRRSARRRLPILPISSPKTIRSTPARREAFVDGVAPLVDMMEGQGAPSLRCHGYSDHYDTPPVAMRRDVRLKQPSTTPTGWAWKAKFKSQNFPVPARSSESAKLMQVAVTWAGKRKAGRDRPAHDLG
ncbi:MAG: FAD-binding protein [Novosphingobium sp.]